MILVNVSGNVISLPADGVSERWTDMSAAGRVCMHAARYYMTSMEGGGVNASEIEVSSFTQVLTPMASIVLATRRCFIRR